MFTLWAGGRETNKVPTSGSRLSRFALSLTHSLDEMIMTLAELIGITHLDFTNCFVEQDCGTRLGWDFGLSPQELILFAKADLAQKDKRGAVNSLTNAKRAIDCQIDRIFKSFGYEFDEPPEHLNNFCDYFCDSSCPPDALAKLRVVNAFGMAPGGLVSHARSTRHKLEHYYETPTEDDVRKAIETAELFVAATEKKLIDFWTFELTDEEHRNAADDGKLSGLYVTQCSHNESDFDIRYYCPFTKKRYEAIVPTDNPSHAALLRMCISLDQAEEFTRSLAYLLKLNEHPMPSNKINLKII